jgi:hypothetical protein
VQGRAPDRAPHTVCCEATGSCTVRGYTCFAARATEELRLARCSKAHNGAELYRTVRFDYGS